MRVVIGILLTCLLFSCKTKKVVQTDELLQFVVILEKSISPKDIKKDIPFELIESSEIDKDINQWSVNYKGMPKDMNKLRASLLSHSKIISVFTIAQYEEFKLKKAKKKKSDAFGKKGTSKH